MISNQNFKNQCGAKTVVYREYILINGQAIDIKGKLYQTAYKDTTFFGTFNLSYIKFVTQNNIDYKGKDFIYYKVVNGIEQRIGHYIVTEIKDNDTEEEVEVTAFDDGIKFANKYTTNLPYGNNVTLYQVLQEICSAVNIPLVNNTITNGDFIVANNQFTDSATYGDVVSAIAQISGNFAFINYLGQLELRFTNATDEIIDEYVKLDDKRDARPITCLKIGWKDISGGAIRRDETLIQQYGENWLIIENNPFAYTNGRQEELADAIFNKVKGFGYSAFESKETFLPYLELGDLVQFKNKAGMLVNSIVLRIETNYDNTTISAPSITNAKVNYNMPQTDSEIARNTKVSIDMANQEINTLISKTDDTNENVSSLTQTMNEFDVRITQATVDANNASNKAAQLSLDVAELRSEIGDVIDTTKYVEGNGAINFQDINESEPIYINIRPIDEDISYLYPNILLFPSNTLIIKTRTLRFTNTETNEIFDYELPDNLRYLGNYYDEFILDNESQTCKVIKRIGLNLDGTKYVLPDEVEVNYDYPRIGLTTGDYTVTMVNYNNVHLAIRLMSSNMYTSQFVTKVEMNSEINQTASEITNSVSATYETKNNAQTNYSQMKLTTDNLTLIVGTKVGEDEIASVISQTPDIIYLQSNNFGWKSNNSEMTTDGKITATAGQIGGFNLGETRFLGNLNGLFNYNEYDAFIALSQSVNWIDLSYNLQDIYDYDDNGTIDSSDALNILKIINNMMVNTKSVEGEVIINSQDPKNAFQITKDGSTTVSIGCGGINSEIITGKNFICGNLPNPSTAKFKGVIINGEDAIVHIIGDGNDNTRIHAGNISLNNFYGNGYVMHGYDLSHYYMSNWTGSQLQFYVDGMNVGALSDKRLKKEIQDINPLLYKAIAKCKVYQYKANNRGGIISFGIMAQDFEKACKEYGLNASDYEIFQTVKYKINDDTDYYIIDYNQYLVLKTEYLQNKLENLEKRLERLEVK